MNVVMFTPGISVSAIGRVAWLLTDVLLREGHSVTVVRCESARHLDAPAHPFGGTLLRWDDAATVHAATMQADIVLYHIGDNFEFHEGAVQWLQDVPGVVCLHDYFLVHLFLGWAEDRPARARAVLRQHYGEGADDAFFHEVASGRRIEGTRRTMPMTEWLCGMAVGVITHSHWDIERVKRACAGPIMVTPLAYAGHGGERIAPPPPSAIARDTINVLTVGHVNPNKRVASVIRAIGASPTLRRRVSYQVVGLCSDAMTIELSGLAREYGVRLCIRGELEDDALALAMHEADVVTCLRYPSLEAASASAIHAMRMGKAIVVTDVGFYAELPDDCVVKVNAGNELEQLQLALERLASEPEWRRGIAGRAWEWSNRTFTTHGYVASILAMAPLQARAMPLFLTATAMAKTLAGWGGSAGQLRGSLGALAILGSQPGP